MRKNLFFLATALVSSLFMAGCSDEEAQGENLQNEKVYFLMSPRSLTRTSTGEDYETTFVTGDAVGIFAYERMNDGSEGKMVVSNTKYTLGTDGTWQAAEGQTPVYADAKRSINYYAYYPYSEQATDPEAINLTVMSDQSAGDAANYNISDALAAQNKTTGKGAKVVKLSFKHIFSLVQVNIDGMAATKDATVTLQNIHSSATLNVKSGEAKTKATEPKSEVKMYALPGNQHEDAVRYAYRAVVPAQSVKSGDVLLTVVSNAKTFQVKYSSDVPYETAKLRVINAQLGESGKFNLSIPQSDVTIEKWGVSDAIEGSGTVEETSPVSPEEPPTPPTPPTPPSTVTSFSPEFTSETAFQSAGIFTKQKITGDTEFWFHRENVTPATTVSIVSEAEGAAIQLQTEAVRGSWNNSNIGYHCTKLFEKASYTLSFKVKSSIADGIVGVGVSAAGDDKFFQMRKPDWSDWNRTVTTYNKIGEAWTEKKVNLDFTQALNEGKSSGVTAYNATTDEDVKGINIYFYNYAANNKLFIKDVKIEKKQ